MKDDHDEDVCPLQHSLDRLNAFVFFLDIPRQDLLALIQHIQELQRVASQFDKGYTVTSGSKDKPLMLQVSKYQTDFKQITIV